MIFFQSDYETFYVIKLHKTYTSYRLGKLGDVTYWADVVGVKVCSAVHPVPANRRKTKTHIVLFYKKN